MTGAGAAPGSAPPPGDAGTERSSERDALQATAAALAVALDDAQLARLQTYLDLLERWNRTYNLTAVRDRPAMRLQHLADSLSVVAPLARQLAAASAAAAPSSRASVAARPRVLDVGSGGGLPGVVIATALPGCDVSCVDSVAKKAAFVSEVAGRLGLPHLHAVHARVEALRARPFDVIVARAFASLADLVRLTEPLLAPGGCWLAMKGKRPDDEVGALPAAIEVFHVEPVRVPGLDAERCLVWMRRRGA